MITFDQLDLLVNEQLVYLGEILEPGGHPRDGRGPNHELDRSRGHSRHTYRHNMTDLTNNFGHS